jgi:Tol biopolymer transport system component
MSDLYLLDLDRELKPKGEPRRLTSLGRHTHSPVWTPDGRRIVFISGQGFAKGVWSIDVSGPAEPQALPIRDASLNLAISWKTNRLVYERVNFTGHILRYSLSDSGQAIGGPAQFLASTRYEGEPQYSPMGTRIAFASDRSGSSGIWVSDTDGSNPVEIFSKQGVLSGTPRWAPNGERLAFHSNAAGNLDIYTIKASGGRPVQLTADPGDDQDPTWSLDGKWVYFVSNRNGRDEVWKTPSEGGAATQITRTGGRRAFESSDGRWLYYVKANGEHSAVWKMPPGGGQETLVVPFLVGACYQMVNGGLYFEAPPADQERASIRFLSFDTGKVTRVSTLEPWPKGVFDSAFAVAPDRRTLLVVQPGEWAIDLMLVENFR